MYYFCRVRRAKASAAAYNAQIRRDAGLEESSFAVTNPLGGGGVKRSGWATETSTTMADGGAAATNASLSPYLGTAARGRYAGTLSGSRQQQTEREEEEEEEVANSNNPLPRLGMSGKFSTWLNGGGWPSVLTSTISSRPNASGRVSGRVRSNSGGGGGGGGHNTFIPPPRTPSVPPRTPNIPPARTPNYSSTDSDPGTLGRVGSYFVLQSNEMSFLDLEGLVGHRTRAASSSATAAAAAVLPSSSSLPSDHLPLPPHPISMASAVRSGVGPREPPLPGAFSEDVSYIDTNFLRTLSGRDKGNSGGGGGGAQDFTPRAADSKRPSTVVGTSARGMAYETLRPDTLPSSSASFSAPSGATVISLPLGWEMRISKTTAAVYYVDLRTGATQWEKPLAENISASSSLSVSVATSSLITSDAPAQSFRTPISSLPRERSRTSSLVRERSRTGSGSEQQQQQQQQQPLPSPGVF